MKRKRSISSRTAAVAAAVSGTLAAGFGVLSIADSQSAESTTVGIEHLILGLLTAVLIALVPVVLHLGGRARRPRAAAAAVAGQLALAALTVVSNVRGEDPAFFAAVAVPSNLLIVGGLVVLAVGLRRAATVSRPVAIALPVSWILTLGGGGVLAPLAGAYWLAFARRLRNDREDASARTDGRRVATAAALAGALALLAAAPAAADSIAYVKKGDVWLSTPDGSRQMRVTDRGGYSYVSQADDGTMVALAPGERLHKLSRQGKVLANFATYVSDGAPQAGPVNRFHGPFEPTISPDGSKVAFEWFNDSYENAPGCTPSSVPPCYVYSSRQGVGITRSDRFTGPEEFGLLTGWIYPHWVSNDTLLRSYANSALNDDTVFDKVGPGVGDEQLDRWFYDQQGGQTVKDVELSRDRKTVAGIVGQGDDRLRVYRPTANPFDAPDWNHTPFHQGNVPVVQPCYEYSGPIGGRFEGVTIAPDGRHLAYGVGNGIWVSNVPDLGAGCAQATENALRIPGGRFPDWGPADVPAGKTTSPPPRHGKQRAAKRKRCMVPRLRGLKAKTARRRLARAGCKAKVRKAKSRRVRRGKVMRQSAKPGKRLRLGATVTVTVSRGR